MLDRIDIHIEVPRVDYEKLSGNRVSESSESIRARVQAARHIQNKRFTNGIVCNADMRKLSLPAIHKHIHILEKGGFVKRKKIGRTNFLALNRDSLKVLQHWLAQYHAYWGTNDETLENYAQYLDTKKPKEK